MAPTGVRKSYRTVSLKNAKDGRVGKASKASRRMNMATTRRLIEVYEQNAKSPLLRLPGELRNRIYEYAIGENKVILFPKWFRSSFWIGTTSYSNGT